jgi:xanthine dehydrogenase small subunit
MTKFILNNQNIETDLPKGLTVLDFVRYQKHLTGTKIGCREGDCGACTVLVGEWDDDNNKVSYRSMTSCLLPLANVENKHVVTVEGINQETGLTPVQKFMVEESGTQCGFCTVGFVVSMTGFALHDEAHNEEQAIAAIDGNICRCTGYKSIERAAKRLTDLLQQKEFEQHALDYAIENQLVPKYFENIKQRLAALTPFHPEQSGQTFGKVDNPLVVGGGTDLYVQRHDDMPKTAANHLFDTKILRGVKLEHGIFEIGASTTVSDLKASPELNSAFPSLQKYLKLISSTPIRNMATVAGNLVNASPIGDLTIFFLALNASIYVQNRKGRGRWIRLKDFYKGYKTLDKAADEFVLDITFTDPCASYGTPHFNFEKVSKRTHLDIASVNSAIFLKTDERENDIIIEAYIAVGGVAPIPLYLQKTSDFLINKQATEDTFLEANEVMQTEINPISDVRGSADYKRLLAKQLLKAHFSVLFG